MELSPPALRVLGALIEKALATPKGYPLSLNALRTATNQSTNRDPVVDYNDIVVRDALKELKDGDLVVTRYASGSNVPKYAHTLDDHLELDTAGVALLGVLMLRGPQTVGELRQRTERLHRFEELGDVHAALDALRDHPFGALVAEVPRQPGQKEDRWHHLLGDGEEPAHVVAPAAPARSASSGASPEELAALQAQVSELRDDVATLRAELERIRRFVGA